MKTANEILLEAVHLKETGDAADAGRVLELLTDLARIVVELEHHHGSTGRENPESEPKAVS